MYQRVIINNHTQREEPYPEEKLINPYIEKEGSIYEICLRHSAKISAYAPVRNYWDEHFCWFFLRM